MSSITWRYFIWTRNQDIMRLKVKIFDGVFKISGKSKKLRALHLFFIPFPIHACQNIIRQGMAAWKEKMHSYLSAQMRQLRQTLSVPTRAAALPV